MAVIAGVDTLKQMPRVMEGAKLAFVLALREAFQSPLTDPNLVYSADPTKTKIKIYTAYPLQLEFFPAVIVSISGGDVSFKYLQEDFTSENPDQSLVNYDGQMSFTVSLTVQAGSTLERERIMDHLIIYVRHLFRSVLHGFNLEYTRDMRLGAENVFEVESKPVYEQTFDIPCYMEYHASIDQSALETIRRIDIGAIAVGAVVVTD